MAPPVLTKKTKRSRKPIRQDLAKLNAKLDDMFLEEMFLDDLMMQDSEGSDNKESSKGSSDGDDELFPILGAFIHISQEACGGLYSAEGPTHCS
jgi:hypothetical protein